jgi:hypothetical protein
VKEKKNKKIFFFNHRLIIQWRFVQRIEKQMTNFMKGFNEIVPQRCIQLFDPKEVEVTNNKKNINPKL